MDKKEQYIYKDGRYIKISSFGGGGANVQLVEALPEQGIENTIYLLKNENPEPTPGIATLLTQITYSELKELRDTKKLIPGMQYQITDYECTTTWVDTRSAGHKFDIIVTADSEDTLNENARATYHYDEGEAYSYRFKDGVTVDNVKILYKVTDDADSAYGVPQDETEDDASSVISRLSTCLDAYGYSQPALFNPDPDNDGHDCFYVYSGQFSITKWVNTNITAFYTLSDDSEVVYTGSYHPEDIFVELAIVDGTPRLYKNDLSDPDYVQEGTDYEDWFNYVDDYTLDGTTYNRWQKFEGSGSSSGFYILTNIIVVNNQFTITQQELTDGIQEQTVIYDKWQEYDIDTEKYTQYFYLTENLVESTGESHEILVPDGYFMSSGLIPIHNLTGWRLQYCLNNDTDRFSWANTNSGKGVIYWLKDENGNECFYDFKNIQFLNSDNNIYEYTFLKPDTNSDNSKNVYLNIITPSSSHELSKNILIDNCNCNTIYISSNNSLTSCIACDLRNSSNISLLNCTNLILNRYIGFSFSNLSNTTFDENVYYVNHLWMNSTYTTSIAQFKNILYKIYNGQLVIYDNTGDNIFSQLTEKAFRFLLFNETLNTNTDYVLESPYMDMTPQASIRISSIDGDQITLAAFEN